MSEKKAETINESTAGPWKWHKLGVGSNAEWVLWADRNDRPIVMAFRRQGMRGAAPVVNVGGLLREFSPDHPDARLIEAAPALAARVKELEAQIESMRHDMFIRTRRDITGQSDGPYSGEELRKMFRPYFATRDVTGLSPREVRMLRTIEEQAVTLYEAGLKDVMAREVVSSPNA